MELHIAKRELAIQNEERELRAAELALANQELAFQNGEKEKRATELLIANKELAFQHAEKALRAEELIIAHRELVFQNEEREKRAEELIIANRELVFQNNEKEKRAEELVIANRELVYNHAEKEKCATELIIANRELAFQYAEKEMRANELIIANSELIFQNSEKEKRATELFIANKELVFQNNERRKRADELIIANDELIFQNAEKERRAAEFIAANVELAFQIAEKERREADLVVANRKLVFQNCEKEKRAEELIIANNVLAMRTAELLSANSELESFSYSVSHDMRAPLRAIHGFARMLKEDYEFNLDPEANRLINNIVNNTRRMGVLIDELLAFSRLGRKDLLIVDVPMQGVVENLCQEIGKQHPEQQIEFKIIGLLNAYGDYNSIRQMWVNLISNAVKYSKLKEKSIVEIGSSESENEIIYSIKDNGAGFDMRYAKKLFGVFQRLHSEEQFEGTGVGLAIVHRIVSKHGGRVWGEGKVNEGAIFHFSLPKIS